MTFCIRRERVEGKQACRWCGADGGDRSVQKSFLRQAGGFPWMGRKSEIVVTRERDDTVLRGSKPSVG